MMRNRSMVLGTMAAVAALAACSSSTAPSASAIGTWHFSVDRMVFWDAGIIDTIDVRPAPFPIVVQDTGAASAATFSNVYGLDAAGDTIIRWGLGAATALTVKGDSLKVVLDDGTESCMLRISGTFHGTSASGIGGVSCADSTVSGGSWSATRS